jgi:hypothetical protein
LSTLITLGEVIWDVHFFEKTLGGPGAAGLIQEEIQGLGGQFPAAPLPWRQELYCAISARPQAKIRHG